MHAKRTQAISTFYVPLRMSPHDRKLAFRRDLKYAIGQVTERLKIAMLEGVGSEGLCKAWQSNRNGGSLASEDQLFLRWECRQVLCAWCVLARRQITGQCIVEEGL